MSDKIVVFDLETGGLDPQRHPVIQFAAVALAGPHMEEVDNLEVKVAFDPATADPEALAMNSYDLEIWARAAVRENFALDLITNFFRKHATVQKVSRAGKPYCIARICAHNAPFDTSFLLAWFKRSNTFLPAGCYEALDTLALSRWSTLFTPTPPADHKLGTLCAYYGIAPGVAHDAFSDVRATAALARKLMDPLRSSNP